MGELYSYPKVHRLGYYPGCGSLAAASRPTEKVRVGDSSLFKRLPECAGDVILPNQLVEAGRPPFAVEDLGGRDRFGYSLAGHYRWVSIMVVVPD